MIPNKDNIGIYKDIRIFNKLNILFKNKVKIFTDSTCSNPVPDEPVPGDFITLKRIPSA